jgi:hypothetical protein
VILTSLSTLKPYVLPILNEANGELGTSFDIDNVMRFVVLPSLMGIALVFDRLIFILMILIAGCFGYAIFQGSCTEPDLVKGVIGCGSMGADHVKAIALDLFHRRDEIRATFVDLGHEIMNVVLILILVGFGCMLLSLFLDWLEYKFWEWKKGKEGQPGRP